MIIANLYVTLQIIDMNIKKDKKSNITKQRRFLEDWFGDPQFKDWLHKDQNDDTVVRFFVCSKTICMFKNNLWVL